jgi:long-chain fatty acid transport protein
VYASAPDLFGFGARGVSMGNAITGSAAGFEAVWYNPAGMAYDQELTFSFGYQHGVLDLEVNGEPWDALKTPALVFGFGIPLPLGGALADRLTLGMGFVMPTTSILIADTKAPGDLTYVLVENRAQTVSIMGGVALRIFDQLSIGWSLLALAELDGAIDVAPNDAGQLGSQARDQLVTDYSNAVGVTIRPLPERLGFGAVWREESIANYALPISVDLGDSFPIPVPVLDISGTAQYDPAQISGSAWGRPVPWLHLEVGFTHKRWSRFVNPIVYTAVPDEFPEQPKPGFSDTVVWRIGVEGILAHREWDLRPRAGFSFEPSPSPEQRGLHNYLDSDRAIPSLGFGFRRGVLTVDAAWQMHLLSNRSHTKAGCVENDEGGLDIPAEEGMRVPPTYPGTNPGCPDVNHGGTIQLMNVQLGVAF